MKAWVVAKNGLVGIDMCRALELKGVDYVASSHNQADVCDLAALEHFYQAHHPDTIFNCSANVNVDDAEGKEKDLAYQVNVRGVANLAHLAKKYDLRLIHVGTDYVFDGEMDRDYAETDPVHPINVYGQTKLEGEQKMLEIYPKAVCVRTSLLYGTGKEGHVTSIIRSLRKNEVMHGIMDQTSTPTYTRDLAEALYDVRDQSGIFHFANGGCATRFEFVLEIKSILESKMVSLKNREITPMTRAEIDRPAKRPGRTVLSTEKIKPFLSKPIRPWQEALRDYIEAVL